MRGSDALTIVIITVDVMQKMFVGVMMGGLERIVPRVSLLKNIIIMLYF